MTTTMARLIVIATLPLVLEGCAANLEPILTISNARFPEMTDLDVVSNRIERAAHFAGWATEVTKPGEILASIRKGTSQHVAQVLIHFDTRSFSITYRSSIALDYDGKRIHKLYNRWIRELDMQIRTELIPGNTVR